LHGAGGGEHRGRHRCGCRAEELTHLLHVLGDQHDDLVDIDDDEAPARRAADHDALNGPEFIRIRVHGRPQVSIRVNRR
jgi:hypothetical protein